MICKANFNDVDEILSIGSTFIKNFKETYNVKEYINDEKYMLFVYKEIKILGFMIVLKNIDCYEIELIVVSEYNRKKGIGSKMIEFLIDSLDKKQVILLEVSVQNKIALKLYAKYGFKVISTRQKYYDGIDAYVMKKVV